MNNLISVLLSTLKARITPIWTKLKYWTSWNFIKANILAKIKNALSKIFQVKPRHREDYYPVLGYLISRRLAHAIVIVVGILCLSYLVWVNPVANYTADSGEGLKTYSYNSIFLRFAKGNVRIRAKSGYIAYEGNVEKGYATGYGQLFNKEGGLVYKGNFAENKYSGQGTLYFPIGQMQYEGEFLNNTFEGNGILYRENGTRRYNGQFSNGEFEGEGVLYDAADREAFRGSFHNGEPVYTQLLGKSATEISDLYTGSRMMYQGDDGWVVVLEEIDAFYLEPAENSSLEDTAKTTAVYVAKDEFVYGEYRLSTIAELWEVFGAPVFEGNSYMTFQELAGADWLQDAGTELPLEPDMETRQLYDEVSVVTDYPTDVLVYLYAFQAGDVTYTFISADRDGSFFMYELER